MNAFPEADIRKSPSLLSIPCSLSAPQHTHTHTHIYISISIYLYIYYGYSRNVMNLPTLVQIPIFIVCVSLCVMTRHFFYPYIRNLYPIFQFYSFFFSFFLLLIFNAKFHSNILAAFSYSLYQGFLFLFIFRQISLHHLVIL